MPRFLACFLVVLLLLQTFGRELLVLDYQANKARITQLFCVNKSRPELRCQGRCHLRQQLRRAAADGPAPAPELAKIKYDALPAGYQPLPAVLPEQAERRAFAPAAAQPCPSRPAPGVFHPPLVRG
ncbi:hypothetical protein [Hymenobacter sp. B81]|uniref:hypothetical protein n=1 Tax=Hymenobacter sp. B81 TaxID=3344878 RepID=UPI0037DCE385